MASFPDLRPASRSANAEGKAVRRFRSWWLLAVSAALLLTASLAVSELATLRGAKAHDASAHLTRELGPPLGQASLVRAPALVRPALGGKVEIRGGGLRITSGKDALALRFAGTARWRQHANGVSRRMPFGREAITFGRDRVEQSLLVNQRQGTKVWRWKLASRLDARLVRDGSVRFEDSPLSILPVEILDAAGNDITPEGLRWSLGRGSLELRLDDAELPVPYVIDPIALVGACGATAAPADLAGCSVHAVSNRSNFSTSPLVRPSSVSTGDLMIAQITIRNNNAITAPAGWTPIGNLRTSGTGLEQRLYYKFATAADTAGTTYSWSWTTSADATGAILAYSGVSSSNPFDGTPTDNAGTGTTATATGLTTTQNGDMLVAFYGAQGNVTASQNSGEGMTQQYTGLSGSGPSSRARSTGADGTQASPGASGSKTAAVGSSTPWVAHLAALTPTLAADGSGTLTSSTSGVSASQTGRTLTFTYTAASGGMIGGTITLVVPSGWSVPSTTGSANGYTTSSTGTVSVSSQTITVSNVTLAGGATMTITYGSTAGGGSGATVTSTTGAQTWQAQQRSSSTGTLTNLGSSPSITVYAADGSGSLSSSISAVSASQSGRTITFTYTAATGGMNNGAVTLAVPSGWSAPSTTSSANGYTTASTGTVSVAGSTITVSGVTLSGGSSFTITYGDTSGGGSGASAPSSTGAQSWNTTQKSTSGGSAGGLTAPTITVYAADGSGTLTTGTTSVSAGQTGRTITFTYTAAAGGMSNGSVTLAVPSGWSAPSTTSSAAGYTTASSGAVSVSSQTITVSSLTLAGGATFTITYGSTAGGGPGATVSSSTGAQTWQVQQKSTSGGSLANIGTSPSITVYAADGSGTLTTGTATIPIGSTGNTITFTYTAAAGGSSNGSVTLAVPSGWSAPSTTSSAAGYTTASSGTVSVSGQTITVSSLTLAGGATFTITYGSTAGGGPGATATSSAGAQTWQAQAKSLSGGTLTDLASSPSITVLAADGSGTLTTPTGTVDSASTGNTITFTYTVATGGMSGGSVTVAVPSGWSAPSTTGSANGYTTASSGTVSVSGSTITVSSLTLAGGATFTITYGSTAGGGAGATAPVSAAAQTWQAQQRSSATGTLTNLATSPSITVNDPSGPTAPSLSFGSFTNASSTGTTVYVREGAAGGFTVTGTSSDAESGIDHLTFPSLGTGWTGGGNDSSSPYQGVYTFNASATAPSGNQNVTATNGWALTSGATPFTVVADTAAPSVTAPTVTGGYYTTTSVAVATNGGSDSGSGVDATTSVVQRDEISLANGSCGSFPGSWTNVTLSGGNDTTVTTGKCYRYRELLSDKVGNQGASAASNTAKVDTTAPSTPTLNFSGLSANAYWNGSDTLFFRPSAGGTFTVTAASTDAQSDVAGYTFGTLNSNGGSNWSGSQAGDRFDYTFGASTTAPSTARTVSSTNGAGTSSSDATYSIAADTAAPSGQAITLTGADAPYYGSASVTFALGDGNDGSGSGVDTSTRTVTRETGDLNGDSCSNFSADAGTFTSPDTAVSGGHCYRYTFTIADRVGNVSSAVTAVAKLDTQAPTVSVTSPVELTGAGNQYYDAGSKSLFFRSGGSGSFRLTSTSSDAHTAIASVSYPDLSGVSGWSTTGTDSSWSSGAAAPGARNVTAVDKASNSAGDTITISNDSAAPTGQAITLTGSSAPYFNTASVTFSLTDGTDGSGSGLDTATRTVTRETGDLAGGSCSNFSADAGTFTSPDTSVSSGRCYRYTFTIADNVGNVSSAVTATAKVDTSSPNVTVTAPVEVTGAGNQYYDAGSQTHFFRPNGSGSFTLTATASDADSGIDRVSFPNVAGVGGWSGSTGGSDSSSPYASPVDYAWSSGASAPGLRSITATNDAAVDGSAGITLAADSSAPTGQTMTLTGANAPYYGSPSVTFSMGDGNDGSGAGVDTSSRAVTRETGMLSGDSCSGFSADAGTFTSPDSAVSNGRCYRYTFTIADRVGNVSSGVTAVAKVDTAGPSITLNDPGTPLGATVALSATASDAETSVAQVVFQSAPAGTSTWTTIATDATAPYTASWDTSSLADGFYDVRAVATDTVSNPASNVVANRYVDHTAPNTTIDSAPAAIDNDATPTFTFSSSESGSTFECRVDGGSWSSCTSPHTTSALAEGSHAFDVRATDAAGNTDTTPASHTWSIDLGAPTVTITAPTTYVNGSDPATYTVTASTPNGDVTRIDFYECSNASTACSTGSWSQFDTDNSAPYSGSWPTPGGDGTKAIRAVAVDVAANTGEHVRTITIDRTAPTNVTVSYPNNYVTGSFTVSTGNGPDPDVDASSGALERQTGDLAADNCSGYGGWSAASSPDTLASGKCAKYRYRVADLAGNWSTATSGNEVKSDTNGPSSNQADPGANLRQTVTLSSAASDTGGSGLASVAFQRRPAGGGSWTTIGTDTTSPYGLSFDTTTVTDGLYDFRSVATDVAGNVESSPTVVANRRVDNTAPSATMTSPGNPVRGTLALTSSTSDGGSGIATVAYELAPSGGSFNSQPASWDTTLGADGLYDLRVTATDAAGNSTTSALITTRVDNTAPALTFSSPAAGAIVSGTVALTASASDASPASPSVSFAYKLASDPPSAYTSTGASWNTSTLPAGDALYDVRARATDDAGNTTTVANTNIRVDNAAPSISITAPAAAINGSLPSPTSFSATASDTGGSGVAQVQFFECSDQSTNCSTGIWSPLGTVAAPGPYTVNWNIPATDGNHALAAVATDNAGHPASAIRNVDVDRTAPNTTITGKPADPSNAVTPSFTFSSSETGSTFECRIDGGAFAPCTSPHDVGGLTDNDHTFEVRATDAAGNTDASPDSWTWARDTNDPTGSLNNPGANVRGVVTLTSAESDPPSNGYASGLASVTFEYSLDGTTWAPIGTNSSPPFDNFLWNTGSVGDGVYQLHIVVRDVAGNVTTTSAVTNVRVDNTPPTTSQNDPGAYLRATKTLTGSAADSGSGIDRVDFQRAPTGGGPWTTIATDSTPGDGFQVSFDTTSVADGHYDFRTIAFDVAGNQAASSPVTDRLVDNTLPDATLNDPGTYLRGAVSLSSTTSDPGGANASGVVSVVYEYSTNGGATWQPTGSTFDSTSVADGNVDLHVVATDAAGNSRTSASLTRLADNTKPATTDNAPAGWQSSAVTVTLSPSDAGSGVNVTEYSVDGNPTYTVGTSVVIPAPADGSNDGAHTIAYFSVDNAGNIETVKSTTVLIDATPPACPSCSAADYLRGTVTLSASPDADGSGIQSVSFEYTDAGGSTWLPIGTDTTGPAPYTADWDTTAVADDRYDLRIRITDNAGNVTTANLPDKVVDNTAPNVATVGAPTEGQIVSGTVAITASASDATSPIASVRFDVRGSTLGTDTTAPYSLNWDTTSGPDGAATIEVVVMDMAGNTTTSATRNVSVDNVSPTPSLADPGQFLRGSVSLSASSDPDTTQVDFERRPAGGGSWVTVASDTTTPWSTPLDTTTLADGLYDFRVVATDQTGNVGTSPLRSNVRVDNAAPSGSVTKPSAGATVGGQNVQLEASVADGGSGVASVAYELRPTGGGSFSTIATSTSSPFSATWDATAVATGSYDLRPVITDRAGNSFTGAVVTINVDVTAPTVTLTNPGATISGTVTLNATVSGTGATQVAFGATPAGGASWTTLGTDTASPWSLGYDTTKLADGVYDLRAVVTDTYGNSSTDVVTGIRVDNTAPRVVSSTPAEGATVTSASSIELVTSEAATPVGVTLDGSGTVPPVTSGTSISYGTGPLAAGPHTLAGELQDAAGKRAPFRLHFTVYPPSSAGVPYVEKNTSAGTATTVGSADGFAAATMPAGAWSTSGSDWIVLRIAPTAAPTGLTNGFQSGPEALDVTAWWALAGTQLHEFSRPVEVLIRSTERGLVPATFVNGAWRVIHRVPSAGTLPSGWDDGFYSDASGFHVLTKHLSLFALLRDVEAPQAPQSIRGYAGPDGLTIRWLPGADNSGTYDFVTLFADSADAGRFGTDYTAATVAGWRAGDSRIFRLRETDLAGNESGLSEPLLPVPSLVGLTRDQAEAALRARGFTVGSVSVGGSGRPGTVTGPEGLVLAEQGAAVDLIVAPGGASTSLVFKVVTAPKLKPKLKQRIAARITLTRAARVTAELYSPRRVKLFTWRLSVKAGKTIVKLRVPRQVRRSGTYGMRWTARSGREALSRRLNIRIVPAGAKTRQPVRVLLSGRAAREAGGKLGKRPRVVTAPGVEPTFDVAANRRTDVRVIVVDVDEFGVSLVRDLHAVFPSVRIIALASGPRTMVAAMRAGAAVVLPRSTPPAKLAKVINKLLKKR